MPSQSFDASERPAAALRRRLIPVLLALAIEALIILMLLTFGPLLTRRKEQALMTFGIEDGRGDKEKQEKRAEKHEKQPQKKRQEHKQEERPRDQPQPKDEKLDDSILPPSFLKLSRNDFAASNIGGIKRSAPSAGSETADSDSGAEDSEAAPGRGPHGERLYSAEWYRRPRDAELDPYLPARAHGTEGWGLIACRTVAAYHVDDCVELGESPRGSGLAGAVRQAAWQFLVRPPRVGGKPMVGTWVSIRIDYIVSGIRVR